MTQNSAQIYRLPAMYIYQFIKSRIMKAQITIKTRRHKKQNTQNIRNLCNETNSRIHAAPEEGKN